MRQARWAAGPLAAVLSVSCGGVPERAAEPAAPSPPPAPRLAGGIPLGPGLVLTLLPNLPGVDGEDVPELARKEVEVLEIGKGTLRLRWTGRVRVEKAESARRREDWVRARANAPRGATPEPTIPAIYETREVHGTLFFPDFGAATELLLPGLWPEGNATIPKSTALWIPENALAELKGGGRASVPLAASAPSLREPAATFLRRAIEAAAKAPAGRPGLWTAGPETAFLVQVDGEDVAVAALGARDWFASYAILDGGGPPLVLSALPLAASPAPDTPQPPSLLRSLLGYRIAEITRSKAEK